MKIYVVLVDGAEIAVTRDADGKFIVPNGWRGIGTALKPAVEPICIARKPLSEKTVAANVLKWGTGALNIDGCRIEAPDCLASGGVGGRDPNFMSADRLKSARSEEHALGRWPANVLHDGSDEVRAAFPDAPGALRSVGPEHKPKTGTAVYGDYGPRPLTEPRVDGSSSAARFFYSAKADSDDRFGSKHPTVKPVDLMRWLCRLVTPPGGTVLDCFAGSGTTGAAAIAEGFDCILIEREAQYLEDIKLRIAHAEGQGAHSGSVKNRNKVESEELPPLLDFIKRGAA